MSLMSELEDLGELMADNLVTMGVTDADASDGLTTLANKILDVPQGGTCIQISLTSNKSILSYADSETATLTATVTENGVVKSGESVQFYKDNVAYGNPVSTDSSGIATISYSSSGSGDVSFTASVGTISSETYGIEDIYKYDSLTENKSQYTVKSGSASITYSSNGVNITGNASDMTETIVEYNTSLPTNYIAELTLKSVSGTTSYGGFLFDNLLMDFDNDGGGRCVLYQAPNYSRVTSFSTDLVNEVIKVEMQNGSLTFYINNVPKGTYTISSTGKYKHRTFRSRGVVVKDLKIKQL